MLSGIRRVEKGFCDGDYRCRKKKILGERERDREVDRWIDRILCSLWIRKVGSLYFVAYVGGK